MPLLNLPTPRLSVRETKNGSREVLDILRRKWVALTPEEGVRQAFLHFLLRTLGYPEGLIAVEHAFCFKNGKPQRADILVHDRKGAPYLLVECKAPQIRITETVFEQISRYNAVLRAPHLVITNGTDHYALSTDDFLHYRHDRAFPIAP